VEPRGFEPLTSAVQRRFEGVNVKVVSELLGHASITITLNTYAHVPPTCRTPLPMRWKQRYRKGNFARVAARLQQ
jgi:integrase